MYVNFMGEQCSVSFGKYHDGGRLAMTLICENGEPMAHATVNIPQVPLASDEVLIKDWSENEGILQALIDADVVEDTGRTVPTGWVKANVCRLSNTTLEAIRTA